MKRALLLLPLVLCWLPTGSSLVAMPAPAPAHIARATTPAPPVPYPRLPRPEVSPTPGDIVTGPL